ncbi:unnamed protein product [Thelazia callipaeda]|uniref:Thioredoxin n=1 Tax=Thelazia callipaeda TaxID=103827 RepID=A0A0N5CVL1_THECL|nr:unnamed protein product [Thelazia callipaeda]
MFCTEESKAIVFEVQDEDDFSEKVINSSVPVIVDFHADWCGPCKMLGPRIEAIIIGRKGNVKLAKVNVDYATDLAIDYEVNVVPTILAFKAGEVVGRIEGAKSDEELDSFVDTLIE